MNPSKKSLLFGSLAGIYSLWILSLAFLALPLVSWLEERYFYLPLFPGIYAVFFSGLAFAAWKNRRGLNKKRYLGLTGIVFLYLFFYHRLIFWIERFHLINFSILVILFHQALSRIPSAKRRGLYAALLTLAIGLLDEGLQHFVPNRTADLRDTGLCLLGIFLGLSLVHLFQPPSPGKNERLDMNRQSR